MHEVKVKTHLIVTDTHSEYHMNWCGKIFDAKPLLNENGLPIFVIVGSEGRVEVSTLDMNYLEDWGLTTVQSLFEAQVLPDLNYIAAGGITSPLDVVKALYLGADAVGIASTILSSLIDNGPEKTEMMLSEWIYGIKAIFVMLGVKNITELRKSKIFTSTDLQNYLQQRKLK